MIQSMTGFARLDGSLGDSSWVWELRSVNGKALDVRFRLPSGLDHLEAALKEAAASHIQRGNVQAALQLDQGAGIAVPTLNEAALDAAVALARQAAQRSNLPMPALEAILAMKGVVDIAAPALDEARQNELERGLIDGFGAAMAKLAKARASEGQAIAAVLAAQIDIIARLTGRVRQDSSRSPDSIRQRLAANVRALLETGSGFDEQRLNQEAAILATKADLQEEIDRLDAHVAAARDLLASGEAVGRRLDFLAQEFNRECNTICSKSNAASVTATGLEMKVVIDQFREQIQNLQ